MTEKEINKKILMVANWKMNPGQATEAQKIADEIKKGISKYKNIDVVVCPSFIHLAHIGKITGKGNFFLGAQNVAWSEKESLTGEVSVAQIQDLGTSHCIVGHSERRAYGETGLYISKKIESLLKRNITPILCVGESSRDEKGQYLHNIEQQLKDSLQNISRKGIEKIVIAYEPLWAIGNSAKRTATREEIEEVSILIRRTISDMYGFKKIPQNKILYGGSVGSKRDITNIFSEDYIDGFLVGRASLSAKTFLPLVEEVHTCKK